ncbi:MAG TPA: hypothetical protein VF748_07555 [Candidatus Acidoferrum sp.]
MLQSEREHIKKVGHHKFHRHLVAANMCVREDARFIGMDKIRSQIAFQAALAATGYERQHLKLSKDCGKMEADTQRATDELFGRAIQAAKGG